MSLFTLHSDIAKELFVGFVLARPGVSKSDLAQEAILAANVFVQQYETHQRNLCKQVDTGEILGATNAKFQSRLVGCPTCHGSGGKRHDPCINCSGTGKVRGA